MLLLRLVHGQCEARLLRGKVRHYRVPSPFWDSRYFRNHKENWNITRKTQCQWSRLVDKASKWAVVLCKLILSYFIPSKDKMQAFSTPELFKASPSKFQAKNLTMCNNSGHPSVKTPTLKHLKILTSYSLVSRPFVRQNSYYCEGSVLSNFSQNNFIYPKIIRSPCNRARCKSETLRDESDPISMDTWI